MMRLKKIPDNTSIFWIHITNNTKVCSHGMYLDACRGVFWEVTNYYTPIQGRKYRPLPPFIPVYSLGSDADCPLLGWKSLGHDSPADGGHADTHQNSLDGAERSVCFCLHRPLCAGVGCLLFQPWPHSRRRGTRLRRLGLGS